MATRLSYPFGAPVTQSRFCIGIDLGTTNCALAYVDTLARERHTELFPIPQHLSESTIGVGELLPSTVALLDSGKQLIGRAALELMEFGAVPVVASAKSWLIVDGIDRRAPVLPMNQAVSVAAKKLSPVEASSLYLSHLREQWNQIMAAFEPSYRLEHQQVVVTVPASFDPIAQALTREAIAQAGLPADTTLLEEPVAAFYHFLEQDEAVLSRLTRRPATILVVDIGGGTTDFSLLELERSGELKRVKVGEHLLIGGDTIDHAIGHLAQRNRSRSLSPRAWTAVLYQARRIKEQYLSGDRGIGSSLGASVVGPASASSPSAFTLTIPGEGSDLFATTESITLSAEELAATILEGFFPPCGSTEVPSVDRSSALREVGLPFPADVAITRHLAAFLAGARVDAVLYTGGTLISPILQDRLTRLITRWQNGITPVILPNRSFLLAVAHGAARSALSTRNLSRRVAMAYPRSLYLDVGIAPNPQNLNQNMVPGTFSASPQTALQTGARHLLCIFAQGHHTGDEVLIEDTPLIATTNEPVQLQLYYSTVRPDDREGDIVGLNTLSAGSVFHPFPRATTILATTDSDTSSQGSPTSAPQPPTLPVQLAIQLTEVGSLALSCITHDLPHRWTIEFHLKNEVPPSRRVSPAPQTEAAQKFIASLFAKGSSETPTALLPRLEKLLAAPRDEWNLPTLRALWSPLADALTRRGRSAKCEVAWLQCAGHALRPGLGDESDHLRINELWRIRTIGTPYKREPAVALATQILWRRVAAGLSEERQRELFDELIKGDISNPETLRLLASLERLPEAAKEQLVGRCLKLLSSPARDTQILSLWCLTRLATRELVYAAPRYLLSWDRAVGIIKRLLSLSPLPEPHRSRALAYLVRGIPEPGNVPGGGSRTGADAALIEQTRASLNADWLQVSLGGGIGHFGESSEEALDSGLLGDTLPPGIRVIGSTDFAAKFTMR